MEEDECSGIWMLSGMTNRIEKKINSFLMMLSYIQSERRCKAKWSLLETLDCRRTVEYYGFPIM